MQTLEMRIHSNRKETLTQNFYLTFVSIVVSWRGIFLLLINFLFVFSSAWPGFSFFESNQQLYQHTEKVNSHKRNGIDCTENALATKSITSYLVTVASLASMKAKVSHMPVSIRIESKFLCVVAGAHKHSLDSSVFDVYIRLFSPPNLDHEQRTKNKN